MNSELEKLGFNSWFQNIVEKEIQTDWNIARVITVNKNNFTVNTGNNEIIAELSGKLMFNIDSPFDYPTTGDWVHTELFDEDSFAVIHKIIPRKSLLKRKTPGKKIDFQLIGANIDKAFIMQSLDFNFNIRRLERYLVMINESKIEPLILLSKSDLINEEEIKDKIKDIKEVMPDIEIIPFSNASGVNIDKISNSLRPGETHCLLGSSGVGKSTLINNLLNVEILPTNEVREKDSRGRHTTTRRQIFTLPNGALIIDTPGMRELGNIFVEEGLSDTFKEIADLALQCRFNDCTHTKESGCAVIQALEEGTISEGRLKNFTKMNKESNYYKMSYIDKRKRDKEFGKMVKSIMKNNRKR